METLHGRLRDLLHDYQRGGVTKTKERVLASFMLASLRAFESAIRDRDWYAEHGYTKDATPPSEEKHKCFGAENPQHCDYTEPPASDARLEEIRRSVGGLPGELRRQMRELLARIQLEQEKNSAET